MPIRIHEVTVSPNVTTVGKPVIVTIVADDITWDSLTYDFNTWGDVRRSFANWDKVKNYIYSKPNPTVDSDAIWTADNFALFDVDGLQISTTNGGTIGYNADAVDLFVKEVLDK